MAIGGVIVVAIVLVIFLGICAGVIALQVFFSRMESTLPGLILPIISFGISAIIIFSIAMFAVTSTEPQVTEIRSIRQDLYTGELIENHTPVTHLVDYGTIGEQIYAGRIVLFFILFNIPTAILLAIYGVCRSGRSKKRDLDMMSLQDL